VRGQGVQFPLGPIAIVLAGVFVVVLLFVCLVQIFHLNTIAGQDPQ